MTVPETPRPEDPFLETLSTFNHTSSLLLVFAFIAMVFLVGGYPIPFADAKVWALRHWPDIDIYDDPKIPGIISRYHKRLGGNVACICVNLKEGPLLGLMRFSEGKLALKCKGLLFNREDDKELAERVQFMAVADPYQDYYDFRLRPEELKHKRATANQEKQEVSGEPYS